MNVAVRVKPGSKKGPLVQPAIDGSLLVYVREPAVEGKANQAVTELLADYYNVPKSNVQMIAGYKSRLKHFKITGI
ncbi:MAG: DUF167 domain-containing protein [Candidatus Saccharimonadales bacterium]